jgi:hypothetical protein
LFGILASLGAVLTLPGIAGIVLTMGTAVDANIIIYERAKEELRSGKTLNEAVIASYSWKGAMRSIVDANVTHILTGAVLFIFGSGPIKGFATTLLIGIVTSLFTSIFIARIFIDRNIAGKNNLTFVTNFSKTFFTNFHYNFLGIKKWSYAFSAMVIGGAVILVAAVMFIPKLFKKKGKVYTSKHDILWVNVLRSKYNLREKMKERVIHYEGYIYDVELERNHTLIVRRNGKVCVSGNCRCDLKEVPKGMVWNDETHSFEPPKELYKRQVERKSKVKIYVGDILDIDFKNRLKQI